MNNKIVGWVFVFIVVASAVALGVAVYAQELPAIFAPPLLLFEAVCVAFLLLFLREVANDNHIGIESRWSGLGRGTGGWRVSRSLIYLACTLLFAGIFAVTASGIISALPKPKEEASTQPPASGAKEQTATSSANVQQEPPPTEKKQPAEK